MAATDCHGPVGRIGHASWKRMVLLATRAVRVVHPGVLSRWNLLGQVVRIFTDTVATWYQKRHVKRGLPAGEFDAVTVIQRANSDHQLNQHLHTIVLNAIHAANREGKGHMFHAAPAPSQQEVESLVANVSQRVLRFLQRRGEITLVTAPGDGEVSAVPDETMGEKDPLLARLARSRRPSGLDFKKPWSDGTVSV